MTGIFIGREISRMFLQGFARWVGGMVMDPPRAVQDAWLVTAEERWRGRERALDKLSSDEMLLLVRIFRFDFLHL